MSYTDIEYEVIDNAALIRLNRPEKLNAFVTRDDAREGAMALLEKRVPKFERLGKGGD